MGAYNAYKKVVYLANAYSSKLTNKDEARLQEACRRNLEAYIAGQLRKKYGVAVLAPIALSAAMADLCEFSTGFSEWAGDDLTFIGRCSDEVWVIDSDGWQDSTGVKAEIDFAIRNDIPVKLINTVTLELNDFYSFEG